jgi:type I restriction-modification system DNA methylase subunit
MVHPQREQTKPIVDTLDQVRQKTGHRWTQVFRDWIEIVFLSLQRDDEGHSKIVEKYKSDFGEEAGQAAIEAYSEGFADLLVAMEDTEADLLGFLYQEYGAASDRNGQFFTPPNTAKFAASMMMAGDGEITDSTPDDPIRINDPTCGSGTLLVAAGQRFEELAGSPYSALFYGQDIDRTCVRMTAINLTVRGLPGCVIHGNSLKMDPTAAWKIIPSSGLINKPIRECEPPTFTSNQRDQDTSSREAGTSPDDAASEEKVEVDVKMGQQTQFSAFTDGGGGDR